MGDQFAAERGQRSAAAGAAAHLGGDHGPAEAAVQLVDERPGALVRHAHGPPGGRDRAERTDLIEPFYLPRSDAPVRVDVDAETQADHGDASPAGGKLCGGIVAGFAPQRGRKSRNPASVARRRGAEHDRGRKDGALSSGERGVGKECVSTCRYRGSLYLSNTNKSLKQEK